jgi:NAD(P)-dependent dehydrogenase (short-subunit alcohol dehydrogenase family)
MPTVLITGTSRGIGLEFARQYAADEWKVFATCREPRNARELRELAQTSGDKLTIIPMDVTDAASVRNAVQELHGTPVDLLINNAGTAGKPGQTTGNIDYTNWLQVLEVNTVSPVRVVEALADLVARSERRLMVTITSGMGSLTDNTEGGSIAYRTSKAAVNMAMRSVAVDLARRGIACIVVHPGWVRTDMGGSSAPLTAEQSVSAMRRVIAQLTPRDSGKFFDYDGREHPW